MSEFRQAIYQAHMESPPLRTYRDLLAAREAWQEKVLAFQKKYHRLPAIIHENLTGVDNVVGLQDKAIEPFGWRKYQQPYLEPVRNDKGDGARAELIAIGPSPSFRQAMCEAYDIPPFYRTQTEVFYPGFELIPDENGDESDDRLFVIFNVYPEDVWDGGKHFRLISMADYYSVKGF